jgi:hypothetical protein
MCGIVGFIGLPNNTCDIRNIKYLIHMNEHRGKDATGIWDPINGVQKTLDKAEDFILDETIRWSNTNILIGHCRSASSGAAKSLDGAHPHEFSNVVGVHNGTLRDCYTLEKKYNEGKFHKKDCEIEKIDYYTKYTDSQLLYTIINNTGTTRVLSHIEGSAALLFHDKNKPNVLYAYRKESTGVDERPLYYGLSSIPNHSGLYFSSVEKSLKIVGCTDIKEIEPGHITIFENGELIEIIKINVQKKIETSYRNYHNNSYSSYYSNNYNNNTNNNSEFNSNIFKDRWFQNKKDSKWLNFTGDIIQSYSTSNAFALHKCKDLDGNIVNIYSNEFPEYPAVFGSGSYAVFTTDVVDAKDENKYLFLKGQVCRIKNIDYQKLKTTISCFDGDREILFKYIRPANNEESKLYHIDPLYKEYTEENVINMIFNKTITTKKSKNLDIDDEEISENENERFSLMNNLKSALAFACILDDEVCQEINHDYEIIKQLDEIIINDEESIENKLNELYLSITGDKSKEESTSILLDLLVAIKILI